MRRFVALSLGVLISLSGAASAAEWGTLTGRFVYDGKAPAPEPIKVDKDVQVCSANPLVDESLVVGKDGGLANVVVFVRTKKVDIHPEFEAELASQKVEMDNAGCRFAPHVAGLWTKQTLVVKNSDPVAHNSNVAAFSNPSINPLIPTGGEVEANFASAEVVPVKVTCNIHPWMTGYVVVRPDPYFAVSDENGNFEIKNLPAGKELEFQVWHERVGFLKNVKFDKTKVDAKGRFEMKLKAGDNDLGTAKVASKALEKK